jgi:tetratricopeptide (TPR) repeat protein
MTKQRRLLLLAFGLVLVLTVAWWRRAESPSAGHAGWGSQVTNYVIADIEAAVAETGKAPRLGSSRKARSRAREAEASGKLNEALDYYAQASALDHEDVDSRLARARLLLRLARAKEAGEVMTEALQIAPAEPAVLELRTRVAMDQGDYPAATQSLDKLLASNAAATSGTWLLAMELEARQGRFEAAAIRLAEGLWKLPDDVELIEAVVELHERFDRVGEIEAYIERLEGLSAAGTKKLAALADLARVRAALAANGAVPEPLAQKMAQNDEPSLLVAAADAWSGGKDPVTAQSFTERALRAAPKDAQAWWAQARVDFALGRTNEAQSAFARAYLLDPLVDPQMKYVELRQSDGFPFVEAYEFLRDLMAMAAGQQRRHRWFINIHRAKLAHFQFDYDNAYAWLVASVKQRPSALAHTGIAQLHFFKQRPDLAFEHLAIALQLDPTCAEAWAVKGSALEQRRYFDGARQCFNEALLHDPEHYALAYRLALADRSKDWRQAYDDMTELLRRRPAARVALLYLRAQMLWRWNKPYEALNDLEEAVRLDPTHLPMRGLFATALQWNGRYGDAVREADWVLAREPLNVNALMARGYILNDEGQYEAALEIAGLLAGRTDGLAIGRMLKGMVHLNTGEFDQAARALQLAASGSNDDASREYLNLARFLSLDYLNADESWTGMITRQRWIGGRSPYWALYRYLGLLRMGEAEDAAEFLELYRIGGNQCNWPVPLIRYLNGELPEEIVLAKAAQEAVTTQERIERLPHFAAAHEITARLVMGYYHRAFGEEAQAREHFQWVVDRPHPLFMRDYWAAKQELESTNAMFALPTSARRSEPILKGPTGAQSPETGLVAWLPLTDDLNDHGPDRLPVTPAGNVRVVGGAAIFSGQGSHIELPHLPLKHREFAVSLWLNVTGDKMMYSLVDQAGMDRCWQHLQVHLRADLQPFLGFYVDDLIAPSSLPSRGGWHHLVFQYVNHRQQIWLDGRLLAERVSPPLDSRDAATFIGRSPGWEAVHDFEGLMRDLRIYSRPLAAGEIEKLADRDALLADLARRSGELDAGSRALLATTKTEIDATAVDARPMLSMAGNRLTISGPPVQIYELQATLDLNQRWDVLQVLTNTTGRVEYLDEDAIHQGERFFRVRLIDYQPVAQPSSP